MSKIISIVSGKGGIGKTTMAVNLAQCFSYFGREAILVDTCLGTPHILIHLGMPFKINTLNDVLKGKKQIKDIIYSHPSGVKLISASLSLDYSLDLDKLPKFISKLRGIAEVILLDMPPGLDMTNLSVLKVCDEVLIVTNPEHAAIYDALKLVKIAEDNKIRIVGIVVNKLNESEYEMHLENIETLLKQKIIGTIPYSSEIKHSHKSKYPLTYINPYSDISITIKKIAATLINEKYETNIPVNEKTFLSQLKERFGL
jgi:MinD-like ATPase involved in chromosome partitioning or flagellar assembly